MEVVVFHGSPRDEGNTDILLENTLSAIYGKEHNVTVFRPSKMNISPCINCGGCEESGECVIQDDMEVVYKAIKRGDRFILASPIFFLGLTAQIKTLIDRCQSFWCSKYLLKRPLAEGPFGRKGLLLIVGGMKMKTGYTCGAATAKAFFRTISVQEHDALIYPEVDAKGAIRDHPSALQEAYEAGRRLVKSQYS